VQLPELELVEVCEIAITSTGPALAIRTGMRAVFVVAVVGLTIASGSCSSSTGDCPDTPPSSRSACDVSSLDCHYDPGTSCECDGEVWYCRTQTCPLGIPGTEPVTCSATDTGCDYSDWEHDCSCGCIDTPAGRYWDCIGGTIGSICPKAPQA